MRRPLIFLLWAPTLLMTAVASADETSSSDRGSTDVGSTDLGQRLHRPRRRRQTNCPQPLRRTARSPALGVGDGPP